MKKFLFLLPLLAIISCANNNNPLEAKFNERGCLECDNYEVGDTFVLNKKKMIVADSIILNAALSNGDDLTQFCVSHITNMRGMFWEATTFNQDIGNWDVSNVTNMDFMFLGSTTFNQDIGNWDVSNVTKMEAMFLETTTFNQDIGNWDVSNVIYMDGMFSSADAFNQDLSQWCVSDISSMPRYFSHKSALTLSNHPIWGTCP